MSQQNLSREITQLRHRVQRFGDYLSNVDETRTRYTLIDPILRALGWDISDPSQVKVEIDINLKTRVKKVDYALYKPRRDERPWILVEAKRLSPAQVENFINRKSRSAIEVKDSWEALTPLNSLSDNKWSELDSQTMEEKTVSHEKVWSQRSGVNHIQQLGGYVREFGIVDGYGVLTDGDEWSIYSIGRDGVFPQKPTKVVRVLGLDDSIPECEEALNLLRRPF